MEPRNVLFIVFLILTFSSAILILGWFNKYENTVVPKKLSIRSGELNLEKIDLPYIYVRNNSNYDLNGYIMYKTYVCSNRVYIGKNELKKVKIACIIKNEEGLGFWSNNTVYRFA